MGNIILTSLSLLVLFLSLTCISNVIIKFYTWYKQGYDDTYKLYKDGKLTYITDPNYMYFYTIESHVYQMGAYKAYKEIQKMLHLDDEGY